jgi:hypothetical protein
MEENVKGDSGRIRATCAFCAWNRGCIFGDFMVDEVEVVCWAVNEIDENTKGEFGVERTTLD